MQPSIESARRDAERVRYSEDRIHHHSYGDQDRTRRVRDAFYRSGLLISQQSTPALSRSFDSVCSRLKIPRDHVDAFVHASAEIQAECFVGSSEECSIRFSSALVNLLDEEEFAFVAGHELGHFLLGHGVATSNGEETLEALMQSRAQEISVDRVGLIACGDLAIAIRAMIKTISGLEARHLRYDVGQFISQLSGPSRGAVADEVWSSHPSMLVRSRALLWFSMDSDLDGYPGSIDPDRVTSLDERVRQDFIRYVDGPVHERIERCKQNLAMWLAAREIVKDGSFGRDEQNAFREMFGEDLLAKLVSFLLDQNTNEVEEAVYERVRNSREELESVIPSKFEDVYNGIIREVGQHFSS